MIAGYRKLQKTILKDNNRLIPKNKKSKQLNVDFYNDIVIYVLLHNHPRKTINDTKMD